ncbi:MAG: glycosyltransferase [Candidatus Nealsonbacteria bacterium]|nr:glycosyltransferase [Candidatus Nealsonbacteria bacterium]
MIDFTQSITIITYFLLVILIIKIAFLGTLSWFHFRTGRKKKRMKLHGKKKPLVSIIIPCYNEKMTLENCVNSLMAQTYRQFEIILVDDGSTDITPDIFRELAARLQGRVFYFSKKNNGKASALNYGIRRADGEIIVCIDADSVFAKDTLRELVKSFVRNPDLGAVGGNVKVANRDKLFNKHQAIEYITGLNVQRRAFAFLGCMQVISGAIGAFDKRKLLAIGGYSSDTIVEDMDITISMIKAGYEVEYNSKAIAYTEAPENIKDFMRQRYRWAFGGFQVLKKHRDVFFNQKYGLMGLVGLPYVLISPWIDALTTLLFVIFLFRVAIFGPDEWTFVFFPIMLLVQMITVGYSLILDRENKKLLLLFGIESLWYYHFINIITMAAAFDYFKGKSGSWDKLKRLGKNRVPKRDRADKKTDRNSVA